MAKTKEQTPPRYSVDAALPEGLDPRKIVEKDSFTKDERFVLLRDLHEWFSKIVRQLPEYSKSVHMYQVTALEKMIGELNDRA